MSSTPIRALIVDDSALFRGFIKRALSGVPGVEIVGEASDGHSALEMIKELTPDLVTLDVEMPVLDGLGTLQEMRAMRSEARVIMISTLTRVGTETTVRALCLGASDFLLKPKASSLAEASAELRKTLAFKIAALFPPTVSETPLSIPAVSQPIRPRSRSAPLRVLGIGISTGGPQALHTLLGSLPAEFPLPILIVQHMPAGFTATLARSLDEICPLKVSEARTGMPIEAGSVLIAPGGKHLELTTSGGKHFARVSDGPHEDSCRPSANLLFRSIAEHYADSALGLVMTGVGSDGLKGCQAIAQQGGTILAQDEASSLVYGMPRSVVDEGLAHKVCALDKLGELLSNYASKNDAAA